MHVSFCQFIFYLHILFGRAQEPKSCETVHLLWGDGRMPGADIFSNSRWNIAQLVEMDEYLPDLDLV